MADQFGQAGPLVRLALDERYGDPKRPEIGCSINRVSGQDSIDKRASKRFESDEALMTQLGPGRMRKAVDQFDLWRGQDHVEIRQLLADFATYLYLPRLRDRQLVIDAVPSAISQRAPLCGKGVT